MAAVVTIVTEAAMAKKGQPKEPAERGMLDNIVEVLKGLITRSGKVDKRDDKKDGKKDRSA